MKMKRKKKNKKTKRVSRPTKSKKKPFHHEILYKHIDWATEIAAYYGFSPYHIPEITKDDHKRAEKVEKEETIAVKGCLPFLNLADRISVLRDYEERGLNKKPQPILAAHTSKKGESKTYHFGLEIIGSDKEIADATVIKTAYEILKDRGYNPLSVAINSMGDRESFGRFVKEFTLYCRKNLENLHPSCRQNFKKNSLCILSCKHEKCQKVLDNGPKPIGFLSEPSRFHFAKVLEYVEMLGIPYQIDNSLVADKTFGCQTIFEILDEKSGRPLAVGARYNILARKIGFKKEVPAIGAKVEIKDCDGRIPTSRKVEKPLVCFVQIGFEAKLKSLQVIEMLRNAKIPTYQSLSHDKLSSQLQIADNQRIPYTIIMGQKEAMENSVIVRCMANRSQETVPLSGLPKYLEKILK